MPQMDDEEYPAPPALVGVIDQDVDPLKWLAVDDSMQVGRVQTSAGPLKIAAITEQEFAMLMKRARVIDPMTKQPRTQPMLLRRWLIAYSISKANGLEGRNEIQADNPLLMKKLTGELTTIQQAVQKLSGLDDEGNSSKPDPEPFLG